MATPLIAGDGLKQDRSDLFLEWMELFDAVHEIEGIDVDMDQALKAYLRAHPEDDAGPLFS